MALLIPGSTYRDLRHSFPGGPAGGCCGDVISPKKGEAFENDAVEVVSAVPPAAHSKPVR